LARADVDEEEFTISLAELCDIAVDGIAYLIGFDVLLQMVEPEFCFQFIIEPILLLKIVHQLPAASLVVCG